jgi:hypothetical protein
MTYQSVKLLALAVICGSSLLAFAIDDSGKDLIAFFILTITGIWFLVYWLLGSRREH